MVNVVKSSVEYLFLFRLVQKPRKAGVIIVNIVACFMAHGILNMIITD